MTSSIEKEDTSNLVAFLEQQETRGNYFSKAIKRQISFNYFIAIL
jgi:hypothetical protein